MELKAYDLRFLGESEEERLLDLCVHGKVSFIIGGEELSDDTEWCVSASAFRFLHTVFENHFIGSEDFLIPHCGHFMIPSADGKSVIVSGCNIGIDFNVIHEDNRIKVQTGDRREYSLSFDEYRKAVLDYADRITAFYASNPPRKTENAFDKEGFRAFVSEYNVLYNKAKEYNNDGNEFCAISFDEYVCLTESDVLGLGEDGISLSSFGFINFRECAYNYSQTNGGPGNCVGEREISDLSFTFYTSPKPTMIKFLTKNRLFERLSKNNARHRFYEFQKQITELGYSTFDLT